MSLVYWAASKLRADGTTINVDRCVGVKGAGPGLYTLTLDNELGIGEACPVITPWVVGAAVPPPVAYDATLAADGVTLSVRFFSSVTGLPLDSAFCLVLWRFMP